MINLFKGYQAASNHEFVRYINQKKDAYDDGSDLTPKQLMTFTLNKYEVLTKQDLWNAKTAKQEQILALSAKLGKIKEVNLKLARTLQSNGKGTNKPPNNQKGKGKNKGKGKGKGKESKWAWKKVAPKENESKTKKFNDYMYHWCETHKAWGMHLLEPVNSRNNLKQNSKRVSLMTTVISPTALPMQTCSKPSLLTFMTRNDLPSALPVFVQLQGCDTR
jgi:hypothetical protein